MLNVHYYSRSKFTVARLPILI